VLAMICASIYHDVTLFICHIDSALSLLERLRATWPYSSDPSPKDSSPPPPIPPQIPPLPPIVDRIPSPNDPGDQILLKIQSAWNHFKSNGCVGLVVMNPTQLIWVQTTSNERDIAFCSNRQTGKKNVLTVQSIHMDADVAGPYDTW
jgi:hypothetical protein